MTDRPLTTDQKTMTPSTLKALRGSIEKWEAIANGSGEDLGPENCSLCKKFFRRDCDGCPVYEATGEECCQGSPYERWGELKSPDVAIRARGLRVEARRAVSDRAKEIARKEVAFLKSLLPK